MKATRPCPAVAPVSTASTSSRQTLVFHFPPFFPSFLSAPHMSDSTPRLPSASCPPAESAQRGSSETSSKRLSPEGLQPGWVPVSLFPQDREGTGKDPGTHQGSSCCCTKVVTPCLIFFFLQVSLVHGEGDTLQIHIGQGSVGQQIKPENRLFELSGRKKDCPGTELKQKLD